MDSTNGTSSDNIPPPTSSPSSNNPTKEPTSGPVLTQNPTFSLTYYPTIYPTWEPTIQPSFYPTSDPIKTPTLQNEEIFPIVSPTVIPTVIPSSSPTYHSAVSLTSVPTTSIDVNVDKKTKIEDTTLILIVIGSVVACLIFLLIIICGTILYRMCRQDAKPDYVVKVQANSPISVANIAMTRRKSTTLSFVIDHVNSVLDEDEGIEGLRRMGTNITNITNPGALPRVHTNEFVVHGSSEQIHVTNGQEFVVHGDDEQPTAGAFGNGSTHFV